MARRFYVDMPWGQIHGQRAGEGPPVALLHSSPQSSDFLAPQVMALAQAGFSAIALDTPGYGGSDQLASTPESLGDFADAIGKAMAALGHNRFGLYGTATGGQIALALARQAPQAVSRLVVENIAHIAPELRAAWAAGYFPSIAAQADGAHLQLIWDMCAKQATRFPWHIESPARRPPPPLAALNAMALGFLRAGPDYDCAYRLAFAAEDAASFNGLTTPAVLIDWVDSAVRPEVRALIAQGLPACVRVVEAGPGLAARLAAIVAAFE
jgi:pimeloyl-ACP methyl ester carboxylesterase